MRENKKNRKYELYELYQSEDTSKWNVKYKKKVRFKIYFKKSCGIFWSEVGNINI